MKTKKYWKKSKALKRIVSLLEKYPKASNKDLGDLLHLTRERIRQIVGNKRVNLKEAKNDS